MGSPVVDLVGFVLDSLLLPNEGKGTSQNPLTLRSRGPPAPRVSRPGSDLTASIKPIVYCRDGRRAESGAGSSVAACQEKEM
jgi:hypothetical protein